MAGPEAWDRSRGSARARCRVRHARCGADRRGRRARRHRCAVVAIQLSVPQLGEEGARPCGGARRRDPRSRGRARAPRQAAAGTTRARRTVDGRPLLLTRRRARSTSPCLRSDCSCSAIRCTRRASRNSRVSSTSAGIRVPVLFASGTRDSLAGKADLTKAARRIKGKVLVPLDRHRRPRLPPPEGERAYRRPTCWPRWRRLRQSGSGYCHVDAGRNPASNGGHAAGQAEPHIDRSQPNVESRCTYFPGHRASPAATRSVARSAPCAHSRRLRIAAGTEVLAEALGRAPRRIRRARRVRRRTRRPVRGAARRLPDRGRPGGRPAEARPRGDRRHHGSGRRAPGGGRRPRRRAARGGGRRTGAPRCRSTGDTAPRCSTTSTASTSASGD